MFNKLKLNTNFINDNQSVGIHFKLGDCLEQSVIFSLLRVDYMSGCIIQHKTKEIPAQVRRVLCVRER